MPPVHPGGVTLLEPAFDLDLVFLEICENSPLLSEYSLLFPGLDWALLASLSLRITRPPCSPPLLFSSRCLSLCLPPHLFPAPPLTRLLLLPNPKEATCFPCYVASTCNNLTTCSICSASNRS